MCRDVSDAKRLKHWTTTAKRSHAWNFFMMKLGYNYRLPNLNAALGCAQLEKLPFFSKRTSACRAVSRKFFGH